MKHTEDDIQAACFTWFRLQYHNLYWNLFAIPNGGKRNIAEAARLKRQGVTSGVWDIFLSIPKYDKGGLYIEMKAGKNKLAENQEAFQKANEQYYHFEVCYSLDQFISAIKKYLS
jgi:hypothetical protein